MPSRSYESPPAPPLNPRNTSYPTHVGLSRDHCDISVERAWDDIPQDWRLSSPSHIPGSTRWSPENYHDLHARHPTFAKDLLPQSNFHEATLLPRDTDVTWGDNHYDALGHESYVQGPNGPGRTRDIHTYYPRKEF
jgi:hypothetical protein